MADEDIDIHNEQRTFHPDTYKAFDHVDSAFFTGCPAESRIKWNTMKWYVERWARQLEATEPMLDLEDEDAL